MSEDETQAIIEWPIASKVPDLRGVPLAAIPALRRVPPGPRTGKGSSFSSAI